jgi:hypothetical protein
MQIEPVGNWGMKKPSLRVTKWLGNIPVEAECTSCTSEAKFRVVSKSHRPTREEYVKELERAFDHHCKTVHAPENSSRAD